MGLAWSRRLEGHLSWVLQVGVHGSWGTVYLLVPEKPKALHQAMEHSVPKCLYVSLEVNETSRILADN